MRPWVKTHATGSLAFFPIADNDENFIDYLPESAVLAKYFLYSRNVLP